MPLQIHLVDRDPAVRQQSADYTAEITSVESQALFDDLIEAMIRYNGIGIAAPQVGIVKRVIVIHADYTDDGEHWVLINPRLASAGEKTNFLEEGCLSVPNRFGPVERPTKVRVKGFTRTGEQVDIKAKGMLARILQHELDHLDGILFIDRAERLYERDQVGAISLTERPVE